MSHYTSRYLLAAFVAIAAFAYVTARPSTYKEFVVSEVINKTMCPITVHIDEDPDRIPRRIKFLKCADRPNSVCNEHTSHGCCKHHHHGYHSECVEIYDFVQVTYKESKAQRAMKVPVGCNCLIEETTLASDVS
ncbi:unnamed protein product [Arctia plantaginis]|uniref:Uncharacterized protein n=1 Tax=Arctia plantaginis TaxID=874455 RepID=A0A8S1BT01_ARCPL|nr:unnamed protein product [Arctia plantaginis]CAB3260174.1 unnamed protein product [Arctia plantaginis]